MNAFLAISTGTGIVGLIVFVLDIVAIVNILGSGKTTGYKVLWVLVVLLLPVLGMILYFLIGRGA